MRILFSVVSLLIVIGIAIWWSVQSFSRDVGLITPAEQQNGIQVETPIDQAKNAKQLIESRNIQQREQ